MGAVKTIAITGATGFLGRATVKAARKRGHDVIAFARRPADATQAFDLADPSVLVPLRSAIAKADVVIHCAASLSGDADEQARDTVQATENLYESLPANIPVVLAGSVAIYAGQPGLIDENSALEPRPAARDAYMRAKLAQERIAADYTARGTSTRILRLGALWDEHHSWNAHIGIRKGSVLLRMDSGGELPLLHVGDAAAALVLAAEGEIPPGISVLNVVGNDRPNAQAWIARRTPVPVVIRFPWQAMLPLAWLARLLHLPVPGLLRPETLRYRMVKRSWSNARARLELNWQPEDGG